LNVACWLTLPLLTAVLPHNSITTFTADAPAAVLARHVFYNGSAFDGGDSAADARDDAAIAPDKLPVLPMEPGSFRARDELW
jgi:hypothetical protein